MDTIYYCICPFYPGRRHNSGNRTTFDTGSSLTHRFVSLIQMREENPEFDMEVEVDIYNVPDIEDNMQLNDLFKRANNNKNIEDKDIPGEKIIEVIDNMVKMWPKNIKTQEDKGAYKPNITKRDLYLALKPIINKSNKKSDEIYNIIVDINKKIGSTSLKNLFGRERVAERKLNIYEKAQKNQFYLNMDCVMNISWWTIILIYNLPDIKFFNINIFFKSQSIKKLFYQYFWTYFMMILYRDSSNITHPLPELCPYKVRSYFF